MCVVRAVVTQQERGRSVCEGVGAVPAGEVRPGQWVLVARPGETAAACVLARAEVGCGLVVWLVSVLSGAARGTAEIMVQVSDMVVVSGEGWG